MKYAWIVLRKELRDMMRDKKTIVASFLVPIVLMPLMYGLIGLFMGNIVDDGESPVAVVLAPAAARPEVRAFLEEALSSDPMITLAEDDDPSDALRQERAQVLIDVPEDAAALLEQGRPLPVRVVADGDKTKSVTAASRVSSALEAYTQSKLDARLGEMGIDLEELKPMHTQSQTLVEYTGETPSAGGGGFMIAMIVPMLIPMLVAIGGVSAATDLVAGEKERQTLEPLLSTKCPRLSILLGKYAAVTLFSIAAMISSMIGYALAFALNRDSLLFMGTGGDIALPVGATVVALLTVLLLGLTFAGIELMLSTFARSYKEAQTYMSYITLAVMLPAFATMMMQAGDVNFLHMLIPVMNAAAGLKMILGGVIDMPLLLLGLAASAAWSALAVALTARMFGKETVLFRS